MNVCAEISFGVLQFRNLSISTLSNYITGIYH